MLLNTEQITRLLNKLLQKTEARELLWAQVGDQDEYLITQPPFHYYVGSRDNDGAAPYLFQLWRQRRDRSDYALVQEVLTEREGELNDALFNLYRAAVTSTLGIENLWEDILKNLDE